MSQDNETKKGNDQPKKRFSFRRKRDPQKTKVEQIETKKPTRRSFLRKASVKKLQPQPQAVIFKKLPEGARRIEAYPVFLPYSEVTIASLPELGGGNAYYVKELPLSGNEREIHLKLVEILSKEIEPPKAGVDAKAHVVNEARRVAKKYGLSKKIAESSWPVLEYYLRRDLVGFGDIDVVMNDPMIEDLSVNGLNMPVYVWHRKYESLPTNLVFTDENALDNLIVKLAHLSGKHISTAFPILDAMLPGKDRIAATFRREVSPDGGSFSIRRFREEPFSIIDLIELGTLNEEIAAYFWLLIENRMTIAVIGGTGAGKTSTLNALASLVKPSMKIVTVEEIPELNLHHDNWVRLVSRESYGLGAFKTGEVNLFELVKTSLRYRPDYIVVGEIRGEEAFVLFQALATGHGGLTTIHAENLGYTVKRLTSHPMNVAKPYIPLLNVSPLIERVRLPPSKHGAETFGRRVKALVEIIDYEDYKTIGEWNPVDDVFKVDLKSSVHLDKIASRHGLTMSEVMDEVKNRAAFLNLLKLQGIRNNVEIAKQVTNYYARLNHQGVRRK
ncbi:MAG TPA: type II/IV secretion system ATPase subunit [Candidatus Bathyarchaeia archaeon]|nr:type II/IV secretion system ATPase subunit [Candidatus Bathyarchaeia archaeon]